MKKIRVYCLRTLLLPLLFLLLAGAAEANIKFTGTRAPGVAKTFSSDGSAGCINIPISAVGSLPKRDYTFRFAPIGLPIEDLLEDVEEVSMNYDNVRSATFCVQLTTAGIEYVQGLTDPLSIEFSILYSGINDPGFTILPGEIVIDTSSGPTDISFSESDKIDGNNMICSPFSGSTEPGGVVSLKKDLTANLTTEIDLSEATLESANSSESSNNKKFLSAEEIVVALMNQVSNAVIDVKLNPQARKFATLENTGGYKGSKFQLQDVVLNNIQHTGGRITATVTGQIPYAINLKSGALKQFTSDINVVKELLAGGSTSVDNLDLNTQINLNASYNFVDAANTIFENNSKKNNFTFSFGSSGTSCE